MDSLWVKIQSHGVAQWKLWAVALVAIATLVFGVIWQITKDRSAAFVNGERTTQQLALKLESSTAAIIRSADLVAGHVGTVTLANLKSDGTPGPVATRFWLDMLDELSILNDIAFIKLDGTIPITAARTSVSTMELVERTFDGSKFASFLTHVQGETDAIYIGSPIRSLFNKEKKWILPITKPVRDSSGQLLGIVYVDIALETFLDLYSEVLPDGNNGVALIRADGRILFGAPFLEDPIDVSASGFSLFQTHLPSSSMGTYTGNAPRLGDARILSYREFKDWPLVLTVDLSIEELLAPWRQSAIFYGLVGVASSLLILLLTAWLSLQIRRDGVNRRTLLLRERSLEESQRLAGVAHFERDISTNALIWAENMFVIHGVHADTFVPGRTSFLSLVVEESRSATQLQVDHFDFPPTNGHLECTICRPSDGAVRDMIYDWEIIHDHDGLAIKAFGVARDVTDLRVTESKARDNEVRLRDITQCMSDFIWETDKSGLITYFESGEDGLALDVEIGVTRSENVDMSAGGGDYAFLTQAMVRHEPFRSLTLPLRNKRGVVRWARLSGNPRFGTDGGFLGFRGAGADITDQREQRLFESEKNKSDALDRLAGGIAHEINNLLQPVVVYSSMGETEAPETVRTQGYFKKIYTASQQAISIVQDILTFAREGRTSLKPVSLAASLTEGLDIIRPTLPPTLSLVGPVGDSDLNVAANPGGLHQVLFNLVRNAVDAAGPQGRVSVEVGSTVLYPKDADRWTVLSGRYGYVSVADNGPGMNEKDLSKVFDPFFTTKPRGVGTGLGLSVVAGLVREWGGAVDVKPQPGETVFTFYVPMAGVEQRAAE